MAWSWSHTQQAYADARENLSELDREKLEIIFAEWRAAEGKHGVVDPVSAGFSERKYDRALKHAKTLAHDTLVEFIWEKASDFATCDNGGFEAWMCPHGCGPHCVSFRPPEEDEADDFDDWDDDWDEDETPA
jgi:hypothetical protein